MGLEISGLVSDQGIGCRMRFVETVFSKLVHQVKDRLGFFGIQIVGFGTFQKKPLLAAHLLVILLTHGTTQQVGLPQRITGQGAGNLHNLLLIDYNTIGILQDRLQLRQVVNNLFAAMLAVDEVIHHAGTERTWAIEGAGRNNVLETGGFELDQHLLHAAGFKLENPGGIAGGDQVIAGLIVVPQRRNVEIRILPFPHQLDGIFDYGQVFKPQKIELDQTDQLDILHRILCVD